MIWCICSGRGRRRCPSTCACFGRSVPWTRGDGRRRLYRMNGQTLKPIYDWVKDFESTRSERFEALDVVVEELQPNDNGHGGLRHTVRMQMPDSLVLCQPVATLQVTGAVPDGAYWTPIGDVSSGTGNTIQPRTHWPRLTG